MSAMTVNGSRAVSVVLTTLWRGAWWAEVDLDPDDATNAPTGLVALAMAGTTLAGTVDPRLSGRFVAANRLRIVAGAGGWDKPVSRQDYHNDGGVLSTQVYQAAASLVGETVVDQAPVRFAADFERPGGAAATVFGDRSWYVDTAGKTQVGTWPEVAPDASLEILEYFPDRQELIVSCDALVLPGTTFTDSRFDGTLIARDVEQTFTSGDGPRARVWCSAVPATRLMSAMTNLIRSVSGWQWNRSYRYRVISQGVDGRVTLQAVNKALGMPDLELKTIWPGTQGDSATVQLSSTCDVRFQEGGLPIVSNWDPGGKPTKRTIDASAEVDVGPSAAAVNLAGGGQAVGRVGDKVSVTFTLADAALILAPPGTGGGPCSMLNPITLTGTITAGSSKVAAG